MELPQLEDYRFFGTERESRETRDPRGQKRLHGAFTGGFSAGYDNTCGSALSWKPSQDRTRKQSVEDFMDDDELEEYNKTVLTTKQQYDTFGKAAGEKMKRELARVSDRAGGVLAVPNVMVAPVAQGIGVRLLLQMGWSRGKSAQFDRTEEMDRLMEHAKGVRDLSMEACKALRVSDTKLEPMPTPKMDSFGLGFDPHKGAFEEFRRKKTLSGQGEVRPSRGQGPGIAFGTGVVHEEDDLGTLEDYVTHDAMDLSSRRHNHLLDATGKPMLRHQGPSGDRLGDRLLREGYSFEIQDIDEDNDDGLVRLEGPSGMPMLSHRAHQIAGEVGQADGMEQSMHDSILPGFVTADDDVIPMSYPRPKIERDYVPRVPTWITLRSALSIPKSDTKPAREPPPGPIKLRIDQVALQVARSGADFEALVTSKDSFVAPGDDFHEYYVWKVHRYMEMMHQGKTWQDGSTQKAGARPRLDIEERSRILGEQELEESRKKMEAIMAAKFVRAGGTDSTDSASKVKIVDMSKRPPVIRRIETWTPDPLLCKRLGVQDDRDDEGRGGDGKRTTKGKATGRRNRRQTATTNADSDQGEGYMDAILAAEEFLDTLLAEAPTKGNTGSDDQDEVLVPNSLHNRPMDLFRTIFENDQEVSYQEEREDLGDGVNHGGNISPEFFKPVPLDFLDPHAPHNAGTGSDRRRDRTKSKTHEDTDILTKRTTESLHKPFYDPTPPSDRARLEEERIRKALRVLDKEKRRKEKRAERKKTKEKKRDKKEYKL